MSRDPAVLALQALHSTRRVKRSLYSLGIGTSAPEKPLYELHDHSVTLNLHEGQIQTWHSIARIVAMIAGSQGGKTSFGPWWLYREIYGDGQGVNGRGGGDYLAVSATFDLFKMKMLPEIRTVFEHILKIGRFWSGDNTIELATPSGKFLAQRSTDPMWGRIILRSAQAAGGLESSTAKGAWLDEAGQDGFSMEADEAVNRRLMLHRGRKLITTTPYNLGWLKQNIIDKADGIDIDTINFASIANPVFPQEEFERQRRMLPAWKFAMFMLGRVERPPGMIFIDFKDEYRERGGHLVKPFPLPSAWARYVGVDPGVVHFCHVWLAHDAVNNIAYIYREGIAERKGTPEQARDLLQISHDNHEHVAAWAVGAKSEIYHRDDFIQAGAGGVVEPLYVDVESRIDAVIRWLRPQRLFIFDTCTGVLDDIRGYSRVLDNQGLPTEKIRDKEKYHYVDALGYGVQHVPEYDMMEALMAGAIHYSDIGRIGDSAY